VPEPTPDTQPYWDGAAAGELRIQRCLDCQVPYFYPRPICPSCGSDQIEWFTASGDATLYSYVINHRPAPGFEEESPYAIAVVQLAEGPRLMTSIRGVPATPEDLVLDMPLRVAFEQRGEVWLPVFEAPVFIPPNEGVAAAVSPGADAAAEPAETGEAR
jgi:uncharacterized OB-fold protein